MKSKKMLITLVITASAIIIIFLIFLGIWGINVKESEEKLFVLKSYKNSVALYCNSELIEVYDSVVLNSLPSKDVTDLNKGITLKTMDEVYRLLEDFDG